MNFFQRILPTVGRVLSFAPNPLVATAGQFISAIPAASPPKGNSMNVLQLIEQPVVLGVALEAAVGTLQAELNAGQTVASSPIKIVINGHTYNVVVNLSKIA